VDDVLEVIKPLTAFFKQLKTDTKKTTVSKSDEGKLVFGGGNKTLLLKDDLNQLKEIIILIRSKIISADF
jgi:meiotically up-regulated gene 157 (Mug157) protein